MCMAFEKECYCGKETARLHHLNTILPNETVQNIYCPSCSQNLNFDDLTMLKDNGWVIEFDMQVADLHREKMGFRKEEVTPTMIFDKGFSSWQGFTPNDLLTANREKTELVKLAKKDPEKYFRLIREWTMNRATRLSQEGWRKAMESEKVLS